MFADILSYQKVLQMLFCIQMKKTHCQIVSEGEYQVQLLMQIHPYKPLVMLTRPGQSFENMFQTLTT